MIRVFVLLILLLTHLSAFALEQITSQLQDFTYLRAEFAQERQLTSPTMTLRSSGELLLSKQEGLWWQQKQPFSMTLILTDDALLQQLEGETAQPLLASGDAKIQQFQRLLRDLLVVDLQALAQHFSLTPLATTSGWALKLEPKAAPLNQLFIHFELAGDQLVKHLTMKDSDGGITLINFSQHRVSNTSLTEEERAVFYP